MLEDLADGEDRRSWWARTPCSTEDVRFPSLGMVVIDEQHRFGVEQRARCGPRARLSEGPTPTCWS